MFVPWAVFESAWDITGGFLSKNGIKALLLDTDNTLSAHSAADPFPEVMPWLEELHAAGICVILVSNNHEPRIKPFAEKLSLPYIFEAKKPLWFGMSRALKTLRLHKREVAMVGDQIFTDILGANLFGIRSIFVFPKVPETSLPFRFKRMCERPFLPDKKRIGKNG